MRDVQLLPLFSPTFTAPRSINPTPFRRTAAAPCSRIPLQLCTCSLLLPPRVYCCRCSSNGFTRAVQSHGVHLTQASRDTPTAALHHTHLILSPRPRLLQGQGGDVRMRYADESLRFGVRGLGFVVCVLWIVVCGLEFCIVRRTISCPTSPCCCTERST